MKIDIKLEGLEQAKRELGDISERDLTWAGIQASNSLAFGVRSEWQQEARRVFDRPVALTLNAVVYIKASKSKPYAEVKLRDEARGGTPPVKYLLAEVKGGPRRDTRFERALGGLGVLPAGMMAVPAQGTQLDAFGNLPRATVKRLLGALSPTTTASGGGRARGRSVKARANVFAISQRGGHLPPGIYERVAFSFGGVNATAVRMVVAFVRSATYRQRYDVFSVAARYIERFGADVLARELEKAVSATRARNAAG